MPDAFDEVFGKPPPPKRDAFDDVFGDTATATVPEDNPPVLNGLDRLPSREAIEAQERASHGYLRRSLVDVPVGAAKAVASGIGKSAVAFTEGLDAARQGTERFAKNLLTESNDITERRADVEADPTVTRAREYVERTSKDAVRGDPHFKAIASVTDPIAEMAGGVASSMVAGGKMFSVIEGLKHPDDPVREAAKAELFIRFQGALGKAMAGADPSKIRRVASTAASTYAAAVASGQDPVDAIGASVAFAGHEATRSEPPRLGVNNPHATAAERGSPKIVPAEPPGATETAPTPPTASEPPRVAEAAPVEAGRPPDAFDAVFGEAKPAEAVSAPVEPVRSEVSAPVEPEVAQATGDAPATPPVEAQKPVSAPNLDAMERKAKGKSLSQVVREAGGFDYRRAGAFHGELDMLRSKDSGSSGLVKTKAAGGKSPEEMIQAVRDAGFNIPADTHPGDFIGRVVADVESGGRDLSPETSDLATLGDVDYLRAMNAESERRSQQEAELPDIGPTGIKNAAIDRDRLARNLGPMEKPLRQAHKEVFDKALDILADDPSKGYRLADELATVDRVHDPVEVAILDIHAVDLKKQYAKAAKDVMDAASEGDADKLARAKSEAERIFAQRQVLDTAAKHSGTEWGRAGSIRQRLVAQDYSLLDLLTQRTVENDGKPLSAEKKAETADIAAAHKKATEELDAMRARAEGAEAALAMTKIEKSISRAAPPRSSVEYGKANKIVTREAYEAARARFREKMSGAKSFVDPTALAEVIKMGAFHVEAGARTFAEWAKAMVEENGEDVRPYLKDAWEASRDEVHAKSVEDITAEMKAGIKTPEQAGDLVRYAGRLAEAFIRSGVHGIENVGPKVHEILKGVDPEITLSETHRAISDYGHKIEMSQDPVKKELRDTKAQAVQIERLLDIVTNKKLPPPQGLQRDTPSDALRKLTRLVSEAKRNSGLVTIDPEQQVKSVLDATKTRMRNGLADMKRQIEAGKKDVQTSTELPLDAEGAALKAEYGAMRAKFDEVFGKPGMTDAQKVDAAIKATKEAIATRESKNAAGDVFPEKRADGPTSSELDALRGQLADLNAVAADMRDAAIPKMSMVEKQARAALRGIEKRTKEMERQITANDFARKQKRQRVPTPEEVRALADQREVEKRWATVREKDMLERETKKAKAVRVVFKEIPDLLRVFGITFDFGSALVQGGLRSLTNPIEMAGTFKKGLKSFASEKAKSLDDARIVSDPGYETAVRQQAGLTGLEPSMKVDEAVRSRWMEKAPVLRNFHRFTHTMLNNMRLEMSKAETALLSRTGEPTPEEHKAIGEAISIITGRGTSRNRKIGQFLDSSTIVALAPRYALSRFQAALGVPMWRGTARTRKVFAMNYVRMAAGVGLLVGIAKAFGKDVDKYGTIHVGPTSIDTTMGLAQVWKLVAKMYKSFAEDDVKARDQSRTFVGDYLRGKLSPLPGAVVSRTMGKTIDRQDATYPNLAEKIVMPLVWRDFKQAADEHGIPMGLVYAGLSAIGARVSTIPPDEPKPKKPKVPRR